jgi:hypothetical protein
MRSFKQYLEYRKNTNILEMAAPPWKKSKGPSIVEIKKTPIFFDEDDIKYLKSFPPSLWQQALKLRYGKLLYEAHKQDGKLIGRLPVNLTYGKKGRGKGAVLKFLVDARSINKLYEKLSGDNDEALYSKLSIGDPDRTKKYYDPDETGKAKTHSEKGKVYGPYAFNFRRYKRMTRGNEDVGVAEGYVEQGDDTIKSVIDRMYDALRSGWYDKELKEKHGEEIRYESRVGKDGPSDVPVEKNNKVWSVENGDFEIVEGDIPGNKIEESVPLIQPSAIVNYDSYKQYENLRKVKSQLLSIAEEEIGEYQSLINIDESKRPIEITIKTGAQNALIKRLKKADAEESDSSFDASKTDSGSSDKSGAKLFFIEKLLDPKYNSELASSIESFSKDYPIEQAKKIAISDFVKNLHVKAKEKMQEITSKTEKYGPHEWNISHLNPAEKEKYPRWGNLGAMHPNKQQVEVIYSSVQKIFGDNQSLNEFVRHLKEDLQIEKVVEEGLDSRIDVDSTLPPIAKKDKIVETYIIALKEAMSEHYNRSEIVQNALRQFENKVGNRSVIEYAKLYKKIISENQNNKNLPKELLSYMRIGSKKLTKEQINKLKQHKELKEAIISVKNFAKSQGSNYGNQLLQLHIRFLLGRYNRGIRPENPYFRDLGSTSLRDFLDSFISKNQDEINALLSNFSGPRTSHSINTLNDLINTSLQSYESEQEKVINSTDFKGDSEDSGESGESKSSSVNDTRDEKDMNKNILISTMRRVSRLIRSITGSFRTGTPQVGTPGTPQAGTPQAGTPQAGTPQAGTPQAGTPGTPQAGTPGTPQARTPQAGASPTAPKGIFSRLGIQWPPKKD